MSEEKRVKIQEGTLFYYGGKFLFAAKEKRRGLAFKQLAIVHSQAVAQLAVGCGNLEGYDFILCKAYEISREHPFICYVWSGYKDNPLTGGGFTVLLPVFLEDFNKLLEYKRENLHLIPLEVGEIIKNKGFGFIVKSDESGTYINDLSNALLNKRRP